ncbi:MAG TPA: biotin/lipoyl-containing protein, partial [Vicinamibacterales bacterium]
RVTEYRAPHLPGLRIDSGIVEGSDVPVYYDPMMAKVIATAESRELAINRLVAGLRGFQIGGIRTNIAFLLRVLASDAFRGGTIDTGYLDREGATFVESLEAAAGTPAAASAASPADGRAVAAFDPWNGVAVRAASPRSTPQRRKRAGNDGHQLLTAPMPATVLKIEVSAGVPVRKGDVVVLLEAMKMELPIRAMADGVVAAVHCHEGDLVQADAPLVEMQ